MTQALPVFVVVPEEHPGLWDVYNQHPEISQVLVNISFGRELTRDIPHPNCSVRMLNIYLRALFLPTLIEYGLIKPNKEKPGGYEAMYCNMQLDTRGLDRKTLSGVLSRFSEGIIGSIGENDSAENTIIAPISFFVKYEKACSLLNQHRELLREQLETPDEHRDDTVLYRVAVVGKIFSGS